MAIPVVPGRTLLADGDAFAYYCAGKEDTSPGAARTNMLSLIGAACRAGGCDSARILVTGRASHKGHRYAIARAKPYQAQRSGSRRPKNWEFLREILETGVPGYPTEVTNKAEADDLFGKYSKILGWQNVVVFAQDKDMNMTEGYHLDWASLTLTEVPAGAWSVPHPKEGHVFGRKWFWLQMLMGDSADNIPGLPKANGKLCGPATAEKLLASAQGEAHAADTVMQLYELHYQDGWREAFFEQAILLWMRNDENSSVLNVLAPGNPLAGWEQAPIDVMLKRIAEAQV